MSDHTVTLTQAERVRTTTNLRPVDAATMLILDHSGRKPRVLMGKRHPSHKFMPGKYVFPGGRIDPEDRRMIAAGALPGPCEQRLAARCVRPSAQRGRALALAAIRETFEETGLLFGSAEYGAPENPPPGVWSEFAAKGIFPDLGAVTFVARAITPPRRPKRFAGETSTGFWSMPGQGWESIAPTMLTNGNASATTSSKRRDREKTTR